MWSAGSSSHCCVCGLCLNTHPSSWSYIPEDAFLCRQSSAATSFIDKAFSSKTSTCGNFLHMLDEFRHIHKEAAADLHISNAPSVPLRHGTEGPFIRVTVLHCSKRPRSSFNGSVTINTPDWKLKKKKWRGQRWSLWQENGWQRSQWHQGTEDADKRTGTQIVHACALF